MGFRGLSAAPRILFKDCPRLARGKYVDEPLEKVAQADPSYLKWMRDATADGQIHLTDEEFFVLAEMMDRYNIPWRGKRT